MKQVSFIKFTGLDKDTWQNNLVRTSICKNIWETIKANFNIILKKMFQYNVNHKLKKKKLVKYNLIIWKKNDQTL